MGERTASYLGLLEGRHASLDVIEASIVREDVVFEAGASLGGHGGRALEEAEAGVDDAEDLVGGDGVLLELGVGVLEGGEALVGVGGVLLEGREALVGVGGVLLEGREALVGVGGVVGRVGPDREG